MNRPARETEATVPDLHRGEEAIGLTPEHLERARSMVGVWLRRDVHWPRTSEPISQHDIRRWGLYAMGDDNPLWIDQDYGKGTIWRSTIAPQTFLYSVDSTNAAPGLPGIQWIHGGSRWEFYRPVRPDDTVTARARVLSVKEKEGKRTHRFLVQTGETLFTNQRDELVARCERDTLRIPRRRSGEGLRQAGSRPPARYDSATLDEIEAAILAESRRGSATRYWEDVVVGEELPSIVKGPLTMVDILAFYVARRATYPPLKLALLERLRHPRNVYTDPHTGMRVHPAVGHIDPVIAGEVGIPRAYDQGWMRIAWLGHLVTSWAGDVSMVRNLDASLTGFNLVGDVTWCHGRVSRKYERAGEHSVELDLHGVNQDGARSLEGRAVVRLPSRSPSDRFLIQSTDVIGESGGHA